MTLEKGTVVDRYIVEGLLGVGGQAEVYLCKHRDLGTRHALKVLHSAGASVKERLLREGRIQAHLRHTNMVAVTDVVMLDNLPCLVMEYVLGPNLRDLLLLRQLSLVEVDALMGAILQGVIVAHDEELIHRDLKPENVFLSLEKRSITPKVADFGMSRIIEPEGGLRQTRSGVLMGTPLYMSPEQTNDSKGVDQRTDVWALGVMMYQMVTGRMPFMGEGLAEVFAEIHSGHFAPVVSLAPHTPRRMVNAIEAALTYDRDLRAQSARELRQLWFAGVDNQGPVTIDSSSGHWAKALRDDIRSLIPDASRQLVGKKLSDRVRDSESGEPVQNVQDTLDYHISDAEFSLASSSASLASPAVGTRRRWGFVVAALGAIGLAVVSILGVGAATWWWMGPFGADLGSSVVEVLAGEPELDSSDLVDGLAADVDVEPAAEPAAEPAPTPTPPAEPASTSVPAPVRVVVPSSAPPQAVVRIPSPVAAPAPLPVAAPLPEPVPTSAMLVSSASVAVRLKNVAGQRFGVGALPAGEYTILVDWDGVGEMRPSGECTIGETGTVTVSCSPSFGRCACN